MRANAYSPTWFELFLRRIPPEQTRHESDFLARHLPLPAFRNLLDICCGEGRHAAEMSSRGYAVTGVDRDEPAIARARVNAPAARFVIADMRELAMFAAPFDAAVCLWQSFGYFDSDTNAAIVRDIASLLRPSGRLVLDVYHRAYFESRAGTRTFQINGQEIEECRTISAAGGLKVELLADNAKADLFQWQVYLPEELAAVAERAGLSCVRSCSGFDETKPASDQASRYQLVLERRG